MGGLGLGFVGRSLCKFIREVGNVGSACGWPKSVSCGDPWEQWYYLVIGPRQLV
jgi:hypothetical protein